jgi:hypothetical protein
MLSASAQGRANPEHTDPAHGRVRAGEAHPSNLLPYPPGPAASVWVVEFLLINCLACWSSWKSLNRRGRQGNISAVSELRGGVQTLPTRARARGPAFNNFPRSQLPLFPSAPAPPSPSKLTPSSPLRTPRCSCTPPRASPTRRDANTRPAARWDSWKGPAHRPPAWKRSGCVRTSQRTRCVLLRFPLVRLSPFSCPTQGGRNRSRCVRSRQPPGAHPPRPRAPRRHPAQPSRPAAARRKARTRRASPRVRRLRKRHRPLLIFDKPRFGRRLRRGASEPKAGKAVDARAHHRGDQNLVNPLDLTLGT